MRDLRVSLTPVTNNDCWHNHNAGEGKREREREGKGECL